MPEINEFIESELARHGAQIKGQGRPDILDRQEVTIELDRLFREAIGA